MPEQIQPQSGSPAPGSDVQPGNPQPADWRASLPEDIRAEKSLASIKDVASLAKSYVEAQRMIGRSIRIPDDTASPDEVAAFRAKLGVPESPDKYNFEIDPNIAPLLEKEMVEGFRKEAHRLGIPAKAAEGLFRWYTGQVGRALSGVAQETKRVEAALRDEWGGAYERNVALAQRTVREMGGEDLLEFLDSTGLGNNPALIKAFAKIGAVLAEDGVIPGEVEGVVTADAARQKIAQIMADPKDLYHPAHKGKPGHDERVAEVQKLFQIAYPNV